jgi:hypothetical protein
VKGPHFRPLTFTFSVFHIEQIYFSVHLSVYQRSYIFPFLFLHSILRYFIMSYYICIILNANVRVNYIIYGYYIYIPLSSSHYVHVTFTYTHLSQQLHVICAGYVTFVLQSAAIYFNILLVSSRNAHIEDGIVPIILLSLIRNVFNVTIFPIEDGT